jgi:outer membrane immunogenic protein
MHRLIIASLAAVGLGAGLGTAASAADRPIPAPVWSWTGCYIGGNVGGIVDGDHNDLTMSGGFLDPRNIFSNPANSDQLQHPHSSNGTSGFAGGAQVGCNYQAGSLVSGVEADFNGSSLGKSNSTSYGPAGPFALGGAHLASSHTETVTGDLDWFSTFRGRLGFTPIPQWLLYATGGGAIARIQSSTNVAFGTDQFFLPGNTFQGSNQETRFGWTAGAGVEYAFANNWSFKAEYLYLDFGSFNYLSSCANCSPAALLPGQTAFAWSTHAQTKENIVRVGMNYKFY